MGGINVPLGDLMGAIWAKIKKYKEKSVFWGRRMDDEGPSGIRVKVEIFFYNVFCLRGVNISKNGF